MDIEFNFKLLLTSVNFWMLIEHKGQVYAQIKLTHERIQSPGGGGGGYSDIFTHT